jgi:hypothetical protein
MFYFWLLLVVFGDGDTVWGDCTATECECEEPLQCCHVDNPDAEFPWSLIVVHVTRVYSGCSWNVHLRTRFSSASGNFLLGGRDILRGILVVGHHAQALWPYYLV